MLGLLLSFRGALIKSFLTRLLILPVIMAVLRRRGHLRIKPNKLAFDFPRPLPSDIVAQSTAQAGTGDLDVALARGQDADTKKRLGTVRLDLQTFLELSQRYVEVTL